MKLSVDSPFVPLLAVSIIFAAASFPVTAFSPHATGFGTVLVRQTSVLPTHSAVPNHNSRATLTSLSVSIGLGPSKEKQDSNNNDNNETDDGTEDSEILYEIPNHEEYRLSRRSKLDEQCDEWFGSLLNNGIASGCLGEVADATREALVAQVPLVNDIEKPSDDIEWTPYVNTKLPWTPLTPAYGVEVFGLPVPRRNAETWRHFDVSGMVSQDYSGVVVSSKEEESMSGEQIEAIRVNLEQKGGWLDDSVCEARLVYINGRFIPGLSKANDLATNLDSLDGVDSQTKEYLARLTDGFTDDLIVPVDNGDGEAKLSSYKKLSGPDHNLGEPTCQFAVNVQQGTACFAALNTIKTEAVAYVHAKEATAYDEDDTTLVKPVLIVNAVTKSGGAADDAAGVSFHPRTLAVADSGARISIVQSCVDLDADTETYKPKLYNGYTQVLVGTGANVTHSYLEESGGMVTGGVEMTSDDIAEGQTLPREIESEREEKSDSHLEAIDVHIMGEKGAYEGTIMSMGGSGRIRIAHSVTLLHTGAKATVNGFSLSGGTQRTDMKTNIHHIAQATESHQTQKNMIGGRATGAFRGRIRVEQSAQQTDSEQLCRTVLLSDKARAWAVPSLEIIADDVQCTHGATVSDLSEEELFYLRSRGLDRSLARNLLMFGFAGDISNCVEPAMLGSVDGQKGLQQRVIQRLENLVPRGERKVKGEFQSS